jgi:hypothetical protein
MAGMAGIFLFHCLLHALCPSSSDAHSPLHSPSSPLARLCPLQIQMLLAVPEATGSDPSNAALRFLNLEIEDLHSFVSPMHSPGSHSRLLLSHLHTHTHPRSCTSFALVFPPPLAQEANIKLGLPAVVDHIITPGSPMYDLSLEIMEQRGLEIFCFLDGLDPMTSNNVQVRAEERCGQRSVRAIPGFQLPTYPESRPSHTHTHTHTHTIHTRERVVAGAHQLPTGGHQDERALHRHRPAVQLEGQRGSRLHAV